MNAATPNNPSTTGAASDPRFPAPASVPVSVLIPVKNESRNIAACLRCLQWAQQIAVIDSQSTDDTAEQARALGAEVHQFHYSPAGWPKKKNWALENVPWRHEWVLIVDADEHITPELAHEIAKIVGDGKASTPCSHPSPALRGEAGRGAPVNDETKRSQPTPSDHSSIENSSLIRHSDPSGYWLNRRFMFMGRWIKHCGYYPSYNLRLFKHRLGRYERIGNLGDTGSGDNEVHEHIILSEGTAEYLKHEMLHYAYPDLATWIEKHNRYSTWEAHTMAPGPRNFPHPRNVSDDNPGNNAATQLPPGPIARRRQLKELARRLPFRPTLRFLYHYILQLGFLDGYEGYVLCRLMAWYEMVSIAKYREIRKARKENL